jgi:uncharacterized protein (DUF362 family)
MPFLFFYIFVICFLINNNNNVTITKCLIKKEKGIHNDLHGFIRTMAEKTKIDISIVSLNPVMIRTGFINGISKYTRLIITGDNPISIDTICAKLLGFKPQDIRYLYELQKQGIKKLKKKNNIL